MNIQNNVFLQILSEAYEKGENEQDITAQELVNELSMKLLTVIEGSDK